MPTLRLKKLIENLSAYCFVKRFLKGKEMHIFDFLSRYPIENGESPCEIIPIAFQLIEEIMRIEESEKGELYWATDYEQDVLYINSLKDENVIDFFMAVFKEVNNRDLDVHNLCNSELDPVANPIRKSALLRKSEADISNVIYSHNQCLGKAEPNNQSVLIKGNETDPVVNSIRKSFEPANLAEVIREHEDCSSKSVHAKRQMKIPYEVIQDQCSVAATRSRNKEASEKVPDIFPLQGEHRKPEHAHKPKKEKALNQPLVMQPRDNVLPVVQPPPQVPQDDIGINQMPPQRQRVETSKRRNWRK